MVAQIEPRQRRLLLLGSERPKPRLGTWAFECFSACRRGDYPWHFLGNGPVLPRICPLFGHLVDRCEPSLDAYIGLLR